MKQDPSGRYISIYVYDLNADGSIKDDKSGTEYTLTATSQSDDAAYNDAMNQYNYNKAKYDQDIQSINAQIEIIQGQDKDLELRLKQLDTEENAISTELDAVKKVISKTVESSFKTFNAMRSRGRGMSVAKDEDASTETLSFRCKSERCRLMPRHQKKRK